MQLQKDFNPSLNTVTSYGDDYLEINKVRYQTAICLQPEGPIRDIDIQHPADINAGFLKSLLGLDAAAADPMSFLDDAPLALPDDAPEVVLIGTGSQQTFLPPEATMPLLSMGIGVETMTTQAAARTYNILMSEERRVLAILLPGTHA